MIRVFSNLLIKGASQKLIFNQKCVMPLQYSFATLTQKMQKKQNQKSQQQIKKQIEHLANKPSFTYMDYKQRILDQLNKLKSSIRAKMSSQSAEQQKQLQIEKKVMSCLYEDELNQEQQLRMGQKKEISLVSQVEYKKVCEIFKKILRYKKIHTMLRGMKQRQQQIPRDMAQLNYLYMKSGLEFQGPKQKYLKYEKKSRIQRGRIIKWKKYQ